MARAAALSCGLSSKIRERNEIKDPGLTRPVSAIVSDEAKTRGPKPPKFTVLSGSFVKLPATVSSASPNRTLSPTAKDNVRISEGWRSTEPVARPSCNELAPSTTAVPINGHCVSTAFNSTSLRSCVTGLRSMARISIVLDITPNDCAMAKTSSSTAVWRDEISKSPPRSVRALSPMPVRIDSATEPTAPIAATPRTSADKKMRNFDKLPFISRRARRHANDQLWSESVTGTALMRLPYLRPICHLQ